MLPNRLIKILSRGEVTEPKLSSVALREQVDTIRCMLATFAEELKTGPIVSISVNHFLSLKVESLYEKLDEQLDRIRLKERKKWWKQKERDLQSIQSALIRLKGDVRNEEEIYKAVSKKQLDRLSKNPMTSEEWASYLAAGWSYLELRPPEHELSQARLHVQNSQPLLDDRAFFESSTNAKNQWPALKDCWLDMLGRATSGQKWTLQEPEPFDSSHTEWTIGKSLSVGDFGNVSVAAVISNRPQQSQKIVRILAVKQISLERYTQTRRGLLLRNSLALSSAIKHAHVVRVLGAENSAHEHLIFMEYVSGGTLLTMLNYLVKITEEEARPLLVQIGKGLGHLHGLGIIHRDLRCENILITLTGCVKISNLDVSRDYFEEDHVDVPRRFFGTLNWMAPDALVERFSTLSDIWSLGCVAIELLTGKPPWHSKVSDTKELEYVLHEMYETCVIYAPPLPENERLGALGRAVLMERVFVRFVKRISIYTLLEDPWLKDAVSIHDL